MKSLWSSKGVRHLLNSLYLLHTSMERRLNFCSCGWAILINQRTLSSDWPLDQEKALKHGCRLIVDRSNRAKTSRGSRNSILLERERERERGGVGCCRQKAPGTPFPQEMEREGELLWERVGDCVDLIVELCSIVILVLGFVSGAVVSSRLDMCIKSVVVDPMSWFSSIVTRSLKMAKARQSASSLRLIIGYLFTSLELLDERFERKKLCKKWSPVKKSIYTIFIYFTLTITRWTICKLSI